MGIIKNTFPILKNDADRKQDQDDEIAADQTVSQMGLPKTEESLRIARDVVKSRHKEHR